MNARNRQRKDKSLARYMCICVLGAVILSAATRDKYHGNGDAMSALVTIFTVLAGFMMAVIAIAADGAVLRRRDWRQDVFHLKELRAKLTRYRMMFHLYLVVPALAFLAHLQLDWSDRSQAFLEYLLLFLAAFSLLWSFRLPGEITQAYVRKLQQAIEDDRAKNNDELKK